MGEIDATAAPSQPGVPAALVNLTAVVTAAWQQGTADHEAADLLHQANDLEEALQERPREGKRGDTQKKLAELQRKVDELIREGKVRPQPPPRSARQ